MNCLYHYCSNEKCFDILTSKTLRLSDIQRSNDYRELSLFFPRLLDEIEDQYKTAPFKFKYKDLIDEDAFLEMTGESYDYWQRRFTNGDFTNFVVCFSEAADSLSQWRGYANNGKGCCIGFSKAMLEEYCEKHENVLRMEKVEYMTDREISNEIKRAARECLEEMRTMREWIVDNMTHDDRSRDTDGLLHFNFDGLVEDIFVDTLRYKSIAFSEENEWRIFFRHAVKKAPRLVCRKDVNDLHGPNGFLETANFLNNKVQFRVTEDDIIPFCPIHFGEFPRTPVIELRTGPKNKIREMDIELFLTQNGYSLTKPFHSRITYC